MSFPRELDEMRTSELKRELARRIDCQAKGLCSYCGAPVNSTPFCNMPSQHRPEGEEIPS